MDETAGLSRRPLRRFWGWGNAADVLAPKEREVVRRTLAAFGVKDDDLPTPRVGEFRLPAPRIQPPGPLAQFFSATPLDRLNHAGGKSYADLARMWLRRSPTPPDWVAYPDDEQGVRDILDWAQGANVAVIPYGGGSSVCGGVEADVDPAYSGAVSLDLERLNRVLEVDPISRAARVQGGALGPELAAQLKPHGLTLRHFPQSFEFSTVGGWIVTRAGGHYATQATHIDDFVEATRMVTPTGTMQTRRLPASGAGPAPDRWVCGSEGILGVLTEAWLRVQVPPRFRVSAAVQFADLQAAFTCVRALAQSGLNPSNCRLLDPAETVFAGVGDGSVAMLMLAFESDDHALAPWMTRALEIVRDHGGRYDAGAAERSIRGEDAGGHRSGAAGAWREAFMRMPYWRDAMVGHGAIMDTFESAVTWDRFDDFYRLVREDLLRAIERATGLPGQVSCRLTHVYSDGPAPYFTFAARARDGTVASALSAWRDIKLAANAAVVTHGGTVTHHHAVGRDHRSGYAVEVDTVFVKLLAAAKQAADPRGIMNPGVLIDPRAGVTGGRGVLGA